MVGRIRISPPTLPPYALPSGCLPTQPTTRTYTPAPPFTHHYPRPPVCAATTSHALCLLPQFWFVPLGWRTACPVATHTFRTCPIPPTGYQFLHCPTGPIAGLPLQPFHCRCLWFGHGWFGRTGCRARPPPPHPHTHTEPPGQYACPFPTPHPHPSGCDCPCHLWAPRSHYHPSPTGF